MWGSRIFTEASTAAERKNYRSGRRRIDRRKERINILQSLLFNDINEEYPNFLPMLRESSLVQEDKTEALKIDGKKYNLFSERDNTDKEYYTEFPTVYHLRDYLVNHKEKVDIRLVYLAIHHIIKYRGNFLYESEFSNNTDMVSSSIQEILKYLEEKFSIYMKASEEEFFKILSDKRLKKGDKKDALCAIFEFEKEERKIITNVINSLLGYKFDLNSIFEIKSEIKMSYASEIDNEEEIISLLGEDIDIYESLKNIYSWQVLQDLLDGEKYISKAFEKRYEQYSEDLNLLKSVYRKYLPNYYNVMFRQKREDNYGAYNGKNRGVSNKKCDRETLYKTIKNHFKSLEDKIYEKQIILERIESEEFLKK